MEKLKQLRINNNYTTQNMANILHISKPFYWQIENNVRKLSYKMAINIASVFDLKPDDIFYEEFKSKE